MTQRGIDKRNGSKSSGWQARVVLVVCGGLTLLAMTVAAPAQATSLSGPAVVAGGYHTCAVKAADSSLVCFGEDQDGQTDVPAGLGAVSAVSAGLYHTCAVKAADSSLVCFGRDQDGQTDVPAGLGAVSAVAAGGFDTCAVKAADSSLVCFGDDDDTQTDVPAGLGAVSAVSAGLYHTCAVKAADSSLVCFGWGGYGQTDVPAGLGAVSAFSAGVLDTCAVKAADSSLVCFGQDLYGQTDVPAGLGPVSAVSAGQYHTCAVKAADSSLVCFGDDEVGETDVPAGLGAVSAVAAGAYHTCAVKAADSSLVCFGYDGNGQTDVPAGLGAVGTGGPSASAPGAPAIAGTTGGDGQVGVTFTAPASDGGSAITGYTVTSNPDGQTCTVAPPAALSCTVTGLADGTAYTFTVTATNSVGTSDPSAPSDPVTPIGAQAITFTSTPPSNAIVGTPYTVTATGGPSGNPVMFSLDARSHGCTVTTAGVVTFTAIGKCLIDANQAASVGYTAAPMAVQQVIVYRTPQTITITSTPPAHVIPGTAYTITATGGGSGNPVLFKAAATVNPICTVTSAGVVTFARSGQCKITATQAGDTFYAAAPPAKQVIHVNRK